MTRFGIIRLVFAGIIACISVSPLPAYAQFSDSYEFLKAVEELDGAKATELLEKPGSTLVNTRDISTGRTGLHIVSQKGDVTWAGFLIKRGANADIRDKEGATALMVAVNYRNYDVAELLLKLRADPNISNNSGETPLIRAVQLGDLALVRLLLKEGANPDRVDNLAGQSARDYASNDPRKYTILEAIEKSGETEPEPEIKIFGPKLN